MIKRRNFKGPLQSELCHASQKLTVIKPKKKNTANHGTYICRIKSPSFKNLVLVLQQLLENTQNLKFIINYAYDKKFL